MREAPSRVIMEALWQHGAAFNVHDPVAMDECRRIYGDHPGLFYYDDPYAALDGADALLIVTEWKVFRSPDLTDMSRRMKQKVVLDGRNIFNPQVLRDAGFTYYGIGRKG